MCPLLARREASCSMWSLFSVSLPLSSLASVFNCVLKDTRLNTLIGALHIAHRLCLSLFLPLKFIWFPTLLDISQLQGSVLRVVRNWIHLCPVKNYRICRFCVAWAWRNEESWCGSSMWAQVQCNSVGIWTNRFWENLYSGLWSLLEEELGILPRAIRQLYENVEERSNQAEFDVRSHFVA